MASKLVLVKGVWPLLGLGAMVVFLGTAIASRDPETALPAVMIPLVVGLNLLYYAAAWADRFLAGRAAPAEDSGDAKSPGPTGTEKQSGLIALGVFLSFFIGGAAYNMAYLSYAVLTGEEGVTPLGAAVVGLSGLPVLAVALYFLGKVRQEAPWIIWTSLAVFLLLSGNMAYQEARHRPVAELQELYAQERYEEAAAGCTELLSERTESLELLSLRASCYRRLNQPEKALSDLSRLIVVDPRDPFGENHIARGMAYAEMGDFDRALADLDRAVTLDGSRHSPGSRPFHFRGWVHLMAGHQDEAIADLTRALQLTDLGATRLARGRAYLNKGLPMEAMKDFRRALELAEDDKTRDEARAGIGECQGKLDSRQP